MRDPENSAEYSEFLYVTRTIGAGAHNLQHDGAGPCTVRAHARRHDLQRAHRHVLHPSVLQGLLPVVAASMPLAERGVFRAAYGVAGDCALGTYFSLPFRVQSQVFLEV